MARGASRGFREEGIPAPDGAKEMCDVFCRPIRGFMESPTLFPRLHRGLLSDATPWLGFPFPVWQGGQNPVGILAGQMCSHDVRRLDHS